jgi:radical SAM protein with 4Fe4S-binding SPASM domain
MDFGVTVAQQAEIYKAGLLDRLKPDSLCTAASSKCRINAAGDVYPCDLISNVTVGNLHRSTLAEIWASLRRAEMRDTILGYKPTRCGSCGAKSECNQCAALRGFNLDGHLEDPVSEACLITTASLLSRSRAIDPTSPAGIAAAAHGGSLDHVLAQTAGDAMKRSPTHVPTT